MSIRLSEFCLADELPCSCIYHPSRYRPSRGYKVITCFYLLKYIWTFVLHQKREGKGLIVVDIFQKVVLQGLSAVKEDVSCIRIQGIRGSVDNAGSRLCHLDDLDGIGTLWCILGIVATCYPPLGSRQSNYGSSGWHVHKGLGVLQCANSCC